MKGTIRTVLKFAISTVFFTAMLSPLVYGYAYDQRYKDGVYVMTLCVIVDFIDWMMFLILFWKQAVMEGGVGKSSAAVARRIKAKINFIDKLQEVYHGQVIGVVSIMGG